ncbi:MAG: Hsp20/alpha crystallin family protein [Anaerolineae bacterium]
MSLKRWEPFDDLVSLRDAMNRLFEESWVRPRGGWLWPSLSGTLAIDIYETDEAVVVKTAVPGVDPDNIDITLQGDTLTIAGEAEADEEVKGERYIRRERRYGSFSRSVALPSGVVADKAEAQFEDGMLTLTLPKAEETKPKSIKVKTGKASK